MFHHLRTTLKQPPVAVHLTRSSFPCSPPCRQHGWEGVSESLLQRRHSRYFTINVKPSLFVIGSTRLRCRCCCCCHILICSPLWKTLASINFTFMVCTHNKWSARCCCLPAACTLVQFIKAERNEAFKWWRVCNPFICSAFVAAA